MSDTVRELYGKKLRVRACGLCVLDESLLLINHSSLSVGDFWAPPGGGIEFGEEAATCIKREFEEETGLKVEVGAFLFACEFIKVPLHAVELFFKVNWVGGNLASGYDPEVGPAHQIIKEARFITWRQVSEMDPDQLHGIFNFTPNPSQIMELRGYFKV